MTAKHDERRTPQPGDAPDDEVEGGSLPTDPELAAALREAVEAVDARQKGGAAAPDGDPPEAESAEEVAARLRLELADAQDRLLRLHADFENFRKRAMRERQEAAQYGSQNLFKDLLSVVDNFDRAIGHARESGGGDLASFLQGVELVRRELLGIFEKHHVTEIEAVGKPFDPSLHEAMAQVENGTVPPGTVIEVLEKGYQLRDRLVRPARVVVTKAPERRGGDRGGDSAG